MSLETVAAARHEDQFILDALTVKLAGMFDGEMVNLVKEGDHYNVVKSSDDTLLLRVEGIVAEQLRKAGAVMSVKANWRMLISEVDAAAPAHFLKLASRVSRHIQIVAEAFDLPLDMLSWDDDTDPLQEDL